MELLGWIFYFVISIILFIFLNFVDKKVGISKIQKLIISIIFMMIIGGICFRYVINYTDNLFLIFVFLMVIDIIYNSYFIDRDFFDKNEKNIEYYILLIIVGFLVNQEFINNVEEVFLTGEDLRIVLWFFSFVFGYSFFKEKNIFSNSNLDKSKFMSTEMVLVNYEKLKHQFNDSIDPNNRELSNVLFALMIYQNSQRSRVLRNFDYLMFRLNGKSRKLGIMQVESDKFISDLESIEIVYKEIEKIYNKKTTKSNKALDIIEKYASDVSYVKYIYGLIEKF